MAHVPKPPQATVTGSAEGIRQLFGALDVSFMLDSEGKIVAMEKITVPPQMIEFPADVFLELARRMKQEIKFPTLPGKDFYPWGISIEPEDVERGYYRFPGMRVAGYPI